MKRWRILAVLLLCLALAGAIACNPFGGEQEPGARVDDVPQPGSSGFVDVDFRFVGDPRRPHVRLIAIEKLDRFHGEFVDPIKHDVR